MATNNSWDNSVTAGPAITLNSGTNAINIASDASANSVNVGTGGAAKVVTVGSTNGASSLALQCGTADFTLASNTGTLMSALDTGEITMPLQPAFLALSADDADVTGNGTIYYLGTNTAMTEVFDQNSDFNTNGTFTAPVTGRYCFHANVAILSYAGATSLQFMLATSNRSYRLSKFLPDDGASQDCVSGSAFADMDASDTARVSVQVSGVGADTTDLNGDGTQAYTSFSGYLVC